MTKDEMINYLKENKIEVPEGWNEIRRSYFKAIKEEPVKPEPIEEPVKSVVLTKKEKLELKRAKLYPRIKELVLEMKGKSNATPEQVKEIFELYNAYYLRKDNPSCNVCLTRVFITLTKLVKKNG